MYYFLTNTFLYFQLHLRTWVWFIPSPTRTTSIWRALPTESIQNLTSICLGGRGNNIWHYPYPITKVRQFQGWTTFGHIKFNRNWTKKIASCFHSKERILNFTSRSIVCKLFKTKQKWKDLVLSNKRPAHIVTVRAMLENVCEKALLAT